MQGVLPVLARLLSRFCGRYLEGPLLEGLMYLVHNTRRDRQNWQLLRGYRYLE